MTPILCIYHANCLDGIAGAWVVHKYHQAQHEQQIKESGLDRANFQTHAIELHTSNYGDALPEVANRHVILVDFSYPRPQMLELAKQAASVLVLDHHLTAQKALVDLPINVHAIFDMDRSGANIAWNHYFPGEMSPLLLDYIEDGDLWRNRLPLSREVLAAIYAYPLTLDSIETLVNIPILQLERDGRALLRKQQTDIAALLSQTVRKMWFGKTLIPVANVPRMFASHIGAELAKGHPFAATYYDNAEGRQWSLRSTPEGANVATIAEAFGGGGHQHAAGFHMTREQAIDFELSGGTEE